MPAFPKEKTLHWTHHAKGKMHYYRLSESRVKRVLHTPKRIEEGIAPDTVAMMQPASIRKSAGGEKWSQEIWVMIEDRGKRRNVVSAWRYPGMTKPRDEISKDFLFREYEEYKEDKEAEE